MIQPDATTWWFWAVLLVFSVGWLVTWRITRRISNPPPDRAYDTCPKCGEQGATYMMTGGLGGVVRRDFPVRFCRGGSQCALHSGDKLHRTCPRCGFVELLDTRDAAKPEPYTMPLL